MSTDHYIWEAQMDSKSRHAVEKPISIGLDFDGTVTACPNIFLWFCRMIRAQGHKIYIITARYPSECAPMRERWAMEVDGILATSRKAKRPFAEARGIHVNIWIDDMPRAINEDIVQIYGWSSPEGTIIDNKHDGAHPVPVKGD